MGHVNESTKPTAVPNCYVERFNGSMRDELLNGETFRTLTEVRVVIVAWIDQYNNFRPHRVLGVRAPAGFAADSVSEALSAK
jgi:transposase InsO family protein